MPHLNGRLASALLASVALHGAVVWLTYRLHQPARSGGIAITASAPAPAAATRGRDAATVPAAGTASAETAPPRPSLAGDHDRLVFVFSAPTHAPNPDRFADGAAASSGSGQGIPRPSFTGRRDEEELRAQVYNAADGYQQQRIRTGSERLSREDIRATPHPALAPNLSSRRGAGEARIVPGTPALGLRLGEGRANLDRASRTIAGPLAEPTASQIARGGARIGKDGEEAEGFARPAVAPGPAATDAARRAERVADRSDSSLVSPELRPGRFELSHPARQGGSDQGRGRGDLPAWSDRGDGSEVAPPGDPRAPPGEDLALATRRRRYNQYIAEVRRKVSDQLEYPRELAVRLEQGDLVANYTIRGDGTIADLRLTKRSPFRQFDHSAIAAIKSAAPFSALPPELGPELRVTQLIEFSNPVVQ